jgi:hypothetical protein
MRPCSEERARELEFIDSLVKNPSPNIKKFLEALNLPDGKKKREALYHTIYKVLDRINEPF